MLAPWAQYLVNHNLKVLVYILCIIYAPLAIFGYIVTVTMPQLLKELARDFKSVASAKKEDRT